MWADLYLEMSTYVAISGGANDEDTDTHQRTTFWGRVRHGLHLNNPDSVSVILLFCINLLNYMDRFTIAGLLIHFSIYMKFRHS